jgi:hypothetical protein
MQGKVEHTQRHPKDINTTPRRPKMVTHRTNHSTDAIHQKPPPQDEGES